LVSVRASSRSVFARAWLLPVSLGERRSIHAIGRGAYRVAVGQIADASYLPHGGRQAHLGLQAVSAGHHISGSTG